jgi:hypothetical protein
MDDCVNVYPPKVLRAAADLMNLCGWNPTNHGISAGMALLVVSYWLPAYASQTFPDYDMRLPYYVHDALLAHVKGVPMQQLEGWKTREVDQALDEWEAEPDRTRQHVVDALRAAADRWEHEHSDSGSTSVSIDTNDQETNNQEEAHHG